MQNAMESPAQKQEFIPDTGSTPKVKEWRPGMVFRPLQTMTVASGDPGQYEVFDGEGNRYASSEGPVSDFPFMVGGALGKHSVALRP
jgi:hypothetical protein